MVKDELNSEEKFFESAIKAERFIKKYRNAMIGVLSATVVLVIAYVAYETNRAATTEAANAAYNALLQNGDDASARAELEKLNPDLYDIWRLSGAVASGDREALETLASSKAPAVSDIAAYELAAITQDAKKLDAYSYRQNAIYKELAAVENAVLLIRSGDTDAARAKLAMVEEGSPLYAVAELLMHYGVK